MVVVNDRLMYLASSFLKRPAIRWVVLNAETLFWLWIALAAVIWLVLMLLGLFISPPTYRSGFIASAVYGVWHSGFIGWAINSSILGFAAAAIPAAVVLVPLIIVGLPFAVFAAMLLGVVSVVGGLLLFLASPFVTIAALRSAVFWVAGKYLASADERERTETAVKAALGLGEASQRSIDGKARIMDGEEFAKLRGAPPTGRETLLGKVGNDWFEYATEKHVLVTASTRGGKGVSLIIPNLLRYRGSVFVLDPKGENAKATHKTRRNLGPVKVLDPFGVSGLPSARFNPLSTLSGAMMVTDAQMMADALIEGKDDHWTSSARGLLAGLILHVATVPGLRGRDLPTVRTLLMQKLPETLEAMEKNASAPQEVRDVGAWGLSSPPNEWQSIVSTVVEQTKWIAAPQIAEILGSGGDQVDFSAYRDRVQSVFVCLPAPYFRTFNKWLRLVVAASIDTLTKQLNPTMPFPTRFVLDELAQLGNLEKVESALTLSAGYGVQLWGIWQHLGDIGRCYPRSGIAGWMSSSGLRLVFATQDNESVKYFAGMCGGAMTETDIRHMPPDQMLCLLDGQNPLLVERVPWFAYWEEPEAKAEEPAPQPEPQPKPKSGGYDYSRSFGMGGG